jgi:hypothetical protein
MRFDDLLFSDKLAMLNLTATLISSKIISINPDQFDDEEILDALAEKAGYLLSKSDLLK